MTIRLEKATEDEGQAIFAMQVEAFLPLLAKYKDDKINPANETIERLVSRIVQPHGSYYQILANNKLAGAVCIFWKERTPILDKPNVRKPFSPRKRYCAEGNYLNRSNVPTSNY